MTTPQKPLPPWIPAKPNAWALRRAKTIFSHEKLINARRDEANILSLTLRGVVRNDPDDPEGLVPSDYGTYQIFERGDLAFKLIDLENVRTSRVGLVPERGIMSSAYVRLRPLTQIDVRYFYYQFYDLYQRQIFNHLGNGVRSTLGQADLLDLRLISPPLPVQHAVADYLDRETARIDALTAAKRRMVALLEERLGGSVSEATHARGVADAAHRFPDDWKLVPLKRCLRSSVYGIGEASQPEGEYAVLGMTNVSSGEIVGTPGGFVSMVDNDLLLAPGDLLFNRTNSRELVGKVGLVRALDRATTFASYLVRLRVNMLADAEYLNYLLNAREVLGLARSMALPSIGQANLNPTRYAAMVLPIPPIGEQRSIVSSLNALAWRTAVMKRLLERQIALLQERRQALITATVTGQMDIPEAA